MVTLRGVQMYEFLDRFVTVALPASVTSVVSPAALSTAVATTTSASRNRSFSLKSSMTRLTLCAA